MSLSDQHRFAMQIAQMSRAWRAELDRRLVGLGLSQARWLVLLHLARFAELPTQRELAQSVGVEGPTLARLLDSLEAQGLVSRQAVPEDRRAKKIALSPQAEPLIKKIEAISTELRQELFAGIDEEELNRCQQVHAKILSNLERR
ncbi:MarR family transcriptional regulator [Pseudomonas sp.]|uniref:MarR family transcriptional regulator n=1 Tax=Pseudomonas sp. TaxID=306 RepID=UPI003A97922A